MPIPLDVTPPVIKTRSRSPSPQPGRPMLDIQGTGFGTPSELTVNFTSALLGGGGALNTSSRGNAISGDDTDIQVQVPSSVKFGLADNIDRPPSRPPMERASRQEIPCRANACDPPLLSEDLCIRRLAGCRRVIDVLDTGSIRLQKTGRQHPYRRRRGTELHRDDS